MKTNEMSFLEWYASKYPDHVENVRTRRGFIKRTKNEYAKHEDMLLEAYVHGRSRQYHINKEKSNRLDYNLIRRAIINCKTEMLKIEFYSDNSTERIIEAESAYFLTNKNQLRYSFIKELISLIVDNNVKRFSVTG